MTSEVSYKPDTLRPQLLEEIQHFCRRCQKAVERGRTASYPRAPHRSRRAVFPHRALREYEARGAAGLEKYFPTWRMRLPSSHPTVYSGSPFIGPC